MIQETEQHKTFFGKIIAAIGSFFSHLVNGAKSAYEELPDEQKDQLVNGVNVSEIIKTGYAKGAEWVVNEVATKVGVEPKLANDIILIALRDVGVNVTSVQDGLDDIADMIQKGITDNDYNGLWSGIAKSVVGFLSSGKLDWVTLSMGLIEWAFQHFIQAAK